MLVYTFIDVRECWYATGTVPSSMESSCTVQIRSQQANNKVPVSATV